MINEKTKLGSASNSAMAPELLPALDDDSSMGPVKGEQQNSIPLGFFGLDSTPSPSLALDARADISPSARLRCEVCNETKAIQFNWCLSCYDVILKSLDDFEVTGYNLNGQKTRPTGVTLKGYVTVGIYLGIQYWEIDGVDGVKNAPDAVVYANGIQAMPFDPIGLFGPVVTILWGKTDATPPLDLSSEKLMNLDDIRTPPTPPPF